MTYLYLISYIYRFSCNGEIGYGSRIYETEEKINSRETVKKIYNHLCKEAGKTNIVINNIVFLGEEEKTIE